MDGRTTLRKASWYLVLLWYEGLTATAGAPNQAMATTYDDEPNPFQDEAGGYDAGSSLSTPSVERISFTPERSEAAVDSSQSTVDGRFTDDTRALPPIPPSPTTRNPRQTTGFKNEIDRYIHSGDDVEIHVTFTHI